MLCRTRLAIRPHSSRAVLFYSQHPNGDVDKSSLHGACPVLSNQKYAANLWVWNTPRSGFKGSPIKKKFQEEHGGAVADPSYDLKVSVRLFLIALLRRSQVCCVYRRVFIVYLLRLVLVYDEV